MKRFIQKEARQGRSRRGRRTVDPLTRDDPSATGGKGDGSALTKRPPGGGLSVSRVMRAGDQAKRTAVFLRRYAMKPSPQKPRIIMAHVEGSGTAAAIAKVAAPFVLLLSTV
jgi:hypothetical protein